MNGNLKMINQEHKEFLKTEIGRKWIIEKSLEVTPKDQNWQSFHTPYDLCEKMISKTNVSNKSILVLFNIEFLEVLIHKFGILSKNITFLADCRLESELANKKYRVNCIVINKDNIWETLKEMKNFDLCFSNPPYNNQLDLKILELIYVLCDEIVIVHPALWLLDQDETSWISRRKIFENKIKSIDVFQPNIEFEIAMRSPWGCICHIDKNYNSTEITYKYMNDNPFQCYGIENITKYGSKWQQFVLPLLNNIEYYKKVNRRKSIIDHCYNVNNITISPSKYYVQLAKRTGTTTGTKNDSISINKLSGVRHDFYTIITKSDICKGIRNYGNDYLTFEFTSESEQLNFIEYLKTYFCRFVYSIYKFWNTGFKDSYFRYIPWMDFTKNWNDQKLYTLFQINEEFQNFIELYLFDYYELRNKS